MEMFLMVFCIGVFGLAVTALSMNAAAPPEAKSELQTDHEILVMPARFFSDGVKTPVVGQAQVPIEALLLQIDNHVRLEQAAAESFLQHPTAAQLHSRTISTLVH
jgi:hypothetical protein